MNNEVTCYTRVPDAWRAEWSLYDWGRRGLVTYGRRWMPGSRGARRKSFDPRWLDDLVRIPCPAGPAIRRVRRETDECWRVLRRAGRLWRVDHYLVPRRVAQAHGLLGRSTPPSRHAGASGQGVTWGRWAPL